MRKIIPIITFVTIISCEKANIDEIPCYININDIELEENITNNITDAWVYIDDNLQGVYELPANFPVLVEGKHKLRIKAGIKDNGIASTRIIYPFYKSFIIEEQEFTQRSTLYITPKVKYLENINLDENLEDFDGNGLNLETDSSFSIDNINPVDGSYGVMMLSDSILSTEVTTDKLEDLPQGGNPIYLEIDYKCNTQFLVGVYIKFPQTGILQKDLLWVNPKEEWNKIYINLESTITEAVNAEYFKVFVAMQRDFTVDTNTICFDNLKIVY